MSGTAACQRIERLKELWKETTGREPPLELSGDLQVAPKNGFRAEAAPPSGPYKLRKGVAR
jgi:hypothetical protein